MKNPETTQANKTTESIEVDATQTIIDQKKEITTKLIEDWKQKTGIPFEYELPTIDESTTWFYLRATYHDWKIILDINIDSNRIDHYGCLAKRDGYKELKYDEITLENLLTAKPINKEFEAKKELLQAKAEYNQRLYEIADKYGVVIDE